MADTNFPTSGTIGANPRATETTARHALGERISATNGRVLMYVLSSGAITQYDVVTIDNTFTARSIIKANADLGQEIAVAADMAFADAEYGWVVVSAPSVLMNVKASTLSGVALFTSDVTGRLAHVSASQTEIKTLSLLQTAGLTATATTGYFSNPFVDVV